MTLATPSKKVFVDKDISEIFVPAEMGELNILPGHAPLVTTLTTGVMRFKEINKDKFEKVVISWGYLEINADQIVLLADTAEKAEEVDRDRAMAALKKAQERMSMAGLGENELEKYRRKAERAERRLSLKDTD